MLGLSSLLARCAADMASRLARMARILLLLLVPAALPALAYASLPDSSWIQGVYDDADGDDVVILATSVTGDLATVPHVQPVDNPIADVAELNDTARIIGPVSTVHPRAPPTS